MSRVARWSAVLLPLLCWSLPAQEPAQSAPPAQAAPSPAAAPPAASPARFLIESIVVSGTERESVRRVVGTYSRLEAGREYSEAEIREAVHRVKRLPFVLDARPALRRGSARGSYELVLEIEEARHVRVGAEGRYDVNVPVWLGDFERRIVNMGRGDLTLGFDHFLDSKTQIVASTGADLRTGQRGAGWTGLSLGLRRYDLAGHASLFELDASAARRGTENMFGLSSALILPLGRNHSLRAGLSWQDFESRHLGLEEKTAAVSLAWIYDRTDDPFAAREGLRLTAEWNDTRTSFRVTERDRERSLTFRSWGNSVSVAYFRPLDRHVSLFGTVGGRCEDDGAADCSGDPTVGLRFVQVGRHNRYRAFADIGAAWGVGDGRPGDVVLMSGVGVRAPWGALRFNFSWAVK